MDRHQLKVMIKKECKELVTDRGLLISLLTVPIIFSIILPILLLLLGTSQEVSTSIVGLNTFIEKFKVIDYPKYLTMETLPLYAVFTYFFLPLFMLLPIMISTVLASSSFIGEKEHKTLEGLLYTPLSPRILVLGKALGCAVPAITLSTISVVVYILVVNTVGWRYFGHIILPNVTWLLVTILISPLLVLLSILLVIGSSQYLKNSKSAQGISMIIVAPIFGMLISQSTGVLILGIFETMVFIIALILLVLVAFFVVIKIFNFEKFILNN
ncbi:ABC transporter permease subunit [Streptococcus thermophilus]|uniref:ABC transporter permease n=1 Tax=Streptococcus thermophilus TaxID=1308 RepID=A0A7U7H1J9_STRTR|nr:ABC transporter permease subunit [Streptococcus thermophilus]EWM62597.1 ABC transporter permease [Streptococcus thermophilus TH1477]MBW7797246.1 ABC transporter permease subunit [Streptococcus thermophilus]MBW7821830.1 ABC transporter permease subunit [Streptococcus thermophilus]MDA5542077.1 ABC transporter permease subunit [Streptococcus thermophilus]MEE1510944.1 ABC transporter permease subunit [Streptococcus thermophilus]